MDGRVPVQERRPSVRLHVPYAFTRQGSTDPPTRKTPCGWRTVVQELMRLGRSRYLFLFPAAVVVLTATAMLLGVLFLLAGVVLMAVMGPVIAAGCMVAWYHCALVDRARYRHLDHEQDTSVATRQYAEWNGVDYASHSSVVPDLTYTRVHLRSWTPANWTAGADRADAVVLVHDLLDRSGSPRWTRLGVDLARALSVPVYTWDWMGHGESSGWTGLLPSTAEWDQHVDHVLQFVQRHAVRAGARPNESTAADTPLRLLVYAVGWGAVPALRMAQRYPSTVPTVVLHRARLDRDALVPPWWDRVRPVAEWLAHWFPMLPLWRSPVAHRVFPCATGLCLARMCGEAREWIGQTNAPLSVWWVTDRDELSTGNTEDDDGTDRNHEEASSGSPSGSLCSVWQTGAAACVQMHIVSTGSRAAVYTAWQHTMRTHG